MAALMRRGCLGALGFTSATDTGMPAAARSSRLFHIVFPREHGAWGMLLVPLLTGGLIGLRNGQGIPLLVALVGCSVALFCARTPLEALAGASPIRARNASERRVALAAL